MAFQKVRELLENEDLEELSFGKASIKPRQTKYYPCAYWHPVKKCNTFFAKIKKNEADLRLNKDAKACKGIKPKCPGFEYTEPYIPEIDEHHILDEDKAETIVFGLRNGDNLLIVGPAGCGKSSTILQLASILNWETNRFSCSEETSSSKIIGQWVVIGDEMMWVDGHVTDAFKNGKILLEEEADFMRPELRGELHTVMEKGGTITLHGRHPKTGQVFRETIPRNKDFRWISTANTIGLGDDSFLYHGTTFQNAASRDRYEAIVTYDYPPAEIETEILTTKTKIDKNTAAKMVSIAKAVREAFGLSQCNFPFTIRRTLSWAKYWQQKGEEESTKLSILNFCSQADQIVVKNFLETYLQLHFD